MRSLATTRQSSQMPMPMEESLCFAPTTPIPNATRNTNSSWTFDQDMSVLEYPDNQTVKFGINMYAKLNGPSCQKDRNPFMSRSGSGASPSRIIRDTKYAGKTLNGIGNISLRVMARDYKLGGNNYRSLRDDMENSHSL